MFNSFCSVNQFNQDQFNNAMAILRVIGQNCIEIEGDIFAILEWSPSDNSTPYHFLLGKKLNHLIRTHLSNKPALNTSEFISAQNQYTDIIQLIAVLPTVSFEFHKNFMYKVYR